MNVKVKSVTPSNATVDEAIASFIENAGVNDDKVIQHRGGNLPVGRSDYHLDYRDVLYSYGSHFPLVQLMPGDDGLRGWWLVNGDRWGGGARNHRGTTDYHQRTVRSAIERTGMPSLIVSFSAMQQAGIHYRTIKPVEVLPDRYEWEPRTRDGDQDPNEGELASDSFRNWEHRYPENLWYYEESVHHLGESLFTAHYEAWMLREPSHFDFQVHRHVGAVREHVSESAYFLSAFDTQEGFGLYFLCQLPPMVFPFTVDEAREALKPSAVTDYEGRAESSRGPVLRQGDVFAIPYPNLAAGRDLPGPSARSAYVLGTNHQATEVRMLGGYTYARGFLRHKPAGRGPDHHAVKLGDGKAWYALVKNTVPDGRAWSAGNGSGGSHVD